MTTAATSDCVRFSGVHINAQGRVTVFQDKGHQGQGAVNAVRFR